MRDTSSTLFVKALEFWKGVVHHSFTKSHGLEHSETHVFYVCDERLIEFMELSTQGAKSCFDRCLLEWW